MPDDIGFRQWFRDNLVPIMGGAILLAAVVAIGVGIYVGGGRLLQDLKDPEVARGLITFLVTLTTVAIALTYAFYAMFGGNDAQNNFQAGILKDRFTFGMPILTALIGVLGTVLGFYFGQAKIEEKKTPPPPASFAADTTGAWLKKGIDFLNTQGKDKALAEFSNPKGQFVKDGFFIYVLDPDAKVLASPEADSVGKVFLGKKDVDGKLYIEAVIKESSAKDSGSVDYKGENPLTKKAEPRTVSYQKLGDLIICADGPKNKSP
jgi:cytochrome c